MLYLPMDYLKEDFNPKKRAHLISTLLILFIVLAIPMTVLVTLQNRDVRSQAQGKGPAPTPTTTSSVVLNQPSPKFADSVNFTAIYPKEATRKVGTRQHENPVIQVDCYQAGSHVFSDRVVFPTESVNNDGTLTGISTFIALGPATKNELSWTSGAASCNVTLYYFGQDLLTHILASTSFEVSQ